MAILTPADVATYAPELDIDPGAINSAVLQAQMIAEGPSGAFRPLEKKSYTETPLLNSRGIVKLARLPIDETPTPVVSIRGHRLLSSFGLPLANNDWVDLVPDKDYIFDRDLGEIRMLSANLSGLNSSAWGRGYGYSGRYKNRPFRRPTQRYESPELRVTYTSGFDFQANPLSSEAQEIKIAVISILKLQQSPLASGLKQYAVTDFYSVTYSGDSAAIASSDKDKTLMQDILMVLRKYRPREFTT